MLMFHFRSTSLHIFSLLVEKRPEPALVYLHVSTRQHSSRMRTTRLPTVHVLVVTTRCQYQGGEYAFPAGPMSGGEGDCEYLPRGTHPTWVPPLRNMRQWYSTPGKDMEPEIPTPCGQTPVKTLPSRKFVGGRQSDAQNHTINWRIDHYLLRYHFLWRPQLLCVRYGRSLLEGQSLFCLFFFFFSEICKQFVVIQSCKKKSI